MTKKFLTIDDFDVSGKTVLLRVDFNAPMSPEGKVLDDARIRSHVKTILDLKDAKVIVLAHQSRPGKSDFTTTKPHAEILSKHLGKEVRYVDDLFGSYARSCISAMVPGDVILLENVRFFSEESLERSPKEHTHSYFVQKLLPYVDFFLNDAFAVSHRSHLSVVGFTEEIPSGAGRIMESEIVNLERGLNGERPCVYALGGSKVDDSLHVAQNVLSTGSADSVLFSGVVGNVVLAAAGYKIGKANMDLIAKLGYENQIPIAKDLLDKYGKKIKYPADVALNVNGKRVEASLKEMGKSEHPANDIGLETIVAYTNEIENAGTVILNGPAGVSENPDFAIGTHEIIRAGTRSKFSIIGGGHISAEVNRLGIEGQFSHISTGGGACIEYLSGVELPGITALEKAAAKQEMK
ncbi:Phosphoglycerate kinase [Methanolapillus ohkumae]|uniref:Phosphoglycerate kinase n=1 Tax=Methanolapillus ohkumae TaxID=3028298 RepID=A0AA97A6J5_9EURY|nr:Phosphoglycerate kinase [Methanosarcinaceae archaeon Am2]